MNNSTLLPEIDGPLNSPSFMAYSILLAVVTLVAGLMTGFTIVALLKATSVAGTVHLFLGNLLFVGLLMAVALMLAVSTSVVLVNVSSSVLDQGTYAERTCGYLVQEQQHDCGAWQHSHFQS